MSNQWVSPRDNGQWGVHGEGNSRDTKIFDNKQDATDYARGISRNQHSELIIQGRDGKIQSKDSHGNDSFPPRG